MTKRTKMWIAVAVLLIIGGTLYTSVWGGDDLQGRWRNVKPAPAFNDDVFDQDFRPAETGILSDDEEHDL